MKLECLGTFSTHFKGTYYHQHQGDIFDVPKEVAEMLIRIKRAKAIEEVNTPKRKATKPIEVVETVEVVELEEVLEPGEVLEPVIEEGVEHGVSEE